MPRRDGGSKYNKGINGCEDTHSVSGIFIFFSTTRTIEQFGIDYVQQQAYITTEILKKHGLSSDLPYVAKQDFLWNNNAWI